MASLLVTVDPYVTDWLNLLPAFGHQSLGGARVASPW